MRSSKVVFAVSLFVGAATAGAVGCGSSKTPAAAASMGATGADSGGEAGPGDYGSHCSPIGGGTCTAREGLTCCVDLLAALSAPADLGTCVLQSECTSTVQYACASPNDCTSGQACCGGISIEAGLFPSLDAGDAGFDGAAFLAAEDDSGGGGGAGLNAALSGITLESFCQASCTATQQVLCGVDSDCPANMVCGSLLSTFGNAAGGAGAGLSGLGGGGGDAGLFSLMTCQVPAGDGGTGEAGAAAGEAGASSDSGAALVDVVDAGAAADATVSSSEGWAPGDGAADGG